MNRPHYDLNQERTELWRERGEPGCGSSTLTRLMFPFCWRIWLRELAGLARLLGPPEVVRGEKEPGGQPPGRAVVTSSDFSISAFCKYTGVRSHHGRRVSAVKYHNIRSGGSGLDWCCGVVKSRSGSVLVLCCDLTLSPVVQLGQLFVLANIKYWRTERNQGLSQLSVI